MIDIMKHQRKACVFNLQLICIALVLEFLALIQPAKNIIRQIDLLLCMVALLPALIYVIGSYRKSAAKYYRIFMYLFTASRLCSLADDIVYSIINNCGAFFACVFRAPVLLCALLLAFVPNFGRKKSLGAAYTILALELINAIREVIVVGAGFDVIVRGISGVVLACIVCMFVLFKYADKAARGTI